MKKMWINDKGLVEEIMNIFHSDYPVVMFQLPTVYTLIAPPTQAGAQALNHAKQRLPEKNYGSAIGNLNAFHRLANKGSLPEELDSAEKLELFSGAFMRIDVGDNDFNSVLVRSGTHQGLLLNWPFRDVFIALEKAIKPLVEPELFQGKSYASVLCTSANLSGDPKGSITKWRRARRFARKRAIKLIIRTHSTADVLGSYPIFHLTPNKVEIKRHGPREKEIMGRLPEGLR